MSESQQDAEIRAYVASEKRTRRRQFRRGALVLTAGGAVCGFLATRMTDIGHATGFAGLGLLLLGSAVYLLLQTRA